ncbi:bifunctional 5,10-methylenetetrahydrofolate dehydrogenase/5,10-methenyltetrahydrofolate cyclohydrolase [Candidatus Parcubacteria bacterium]|nr:bifunctional 5,10-methylenetetrahydrofolate dehydrogenase/5,10-methenyltetrahydrofolate cyclohydrolase [Candidatus Parcubacteria bacterium]
MTVHVDGKRIAHDIQEKLKRIVDQYDGSMIFHMVYVGSDKVIDNYLKYKEEFASCIGIRTHIHRFPADISTEELEKEIHSIVLSNEAMIIQLPLPSHINTQKILNMVPSHIDVDVLSEEGRELFSQGSNIFIPPVTASIIEICSRYTISLSDLNIVLIGKGRLVGKPFSQWLDYHHISYTIIDIDTQVEERVKLLSSADMIVTGVGIPQLVLPHHVKDGVIIIDAGTSESNTTVVGDVHLDIAEKSSLFTPVPGGIGPITIAKLYTNVVNFYV